jgi:hypothetical protein
MQLKVNEAALFPFKAKSLRYWPFWRNNATYPII